MAKPTKASPILAVVVWDDAWAGGNDLIGIHDVDEKHHPSVMQSLGWVLKDNEVGVMIANERCLDKGDECYRGSTFIPRSLVKSITPFKFSSPKKAQHAKTPEIPPSTDPAG